MVLGVLVFGQLMMIVNIGCIWIVSIGFTEFDLGLYSYIEIFVFK
jgi:hypothetical protein